MGKSILLSEKEGVSEDSSFKKIDYEATMNTNITGFSYGYPKGYKLYVRIRAFNTVSGNKVYGTWSEVESATVK